MDKASPVVLSSWPLVILGYFFSLNFAEFTCAAAGVALHM